VCVMLKPGIKDTLLTIFGVVALIVFVLSCRPSFSPDGNQVVFPIVDGKTDVPSVALYDLKKKTLETIFVGPPREEFFVAQWLPDGKQVLVNGISFIAILPLGSSNPTRLISLKEKLDGESLMIPPPVIGKYQFIHDEKSPLRVNLETMEVQNIPDLFDGFFVAKGDQLYYISQLKIGEDDGYELGRLDTEKLNKNSILQLKKNEYGELSCFMAPNGNGSRFAWPAEYEKTQRILLIQGNALEKSILVADGDIDINLGNVEWSTDEKTLYVAFAKDLNKDDLWQYGILEVPVNGGRIRDIPLFTLNDGDEDGLVMFQIALSADGRRIAATSACMGDNLKKPEDNAFYLVDLSSSERNVTKITIPLPSE